MIYVFELKAFFTHFDIFWKNIFSLVIGKIYIYKNVMR